ncbi:T9SS type A sorting domain-containing protein [Hymenobacter negativus]|uniref:T9SS type A sorting domain-containing protein n=1 Tax=Hymenobacter negativus TaxID=2795026 RepID=A0ABS3QHW4_9BACT|nr:T9SS type A sorting domain-containing protein [Hymenobacter negativus]MBO2010716.1 T9SS type A sorting domain-containing protein [Hymenobacter negativus]
MIKTILCFWLLTVGALSSGRAQAPVWAWATTPIPFAAADEARPNCAALDHAGNVLVTGYLVGRATFGSFTLTGSSAQGQDGFIGKLSPTGQWLWVAQAPLGFITSVVADGAGGAFVNGTFVGTATFGATQLTSVGQADVFVARVSASGQWLWATSFGGPGYDGNTRVQSDAAGNVWLSASFSGQVSVGAQQLSSAGATDVLVGKLSAVGQWLWAVSAGGPDFDGASAFALDGSGNAVVAGNFRSQASFGTTLLTNQGMVGGDVFVAKISDTGQWLWANRAGGPSPIGCGAALATGQGETVVTGFFRGNATFGSTLLNGLPSGSSTLYVARLSAMGQWQGTASVTNASGNALGLDANGNVLVAGQIEGGATFGNTTLACAGASDGFVAQLPNNGQWGWALGVGGAGADYCATLSADRLGNVAVTGTFQRAMTLAGNSFTNQTLYGYGGFVARIMGAALSTATTGLAESGLTVYPNPINTNQTKCRVHLKLSAPASSKVQVVNLLGQQVAMCVPVAAAGFAEVDLPQLSAGVYHVLATGSDGRALGKTTLVVE